MNKITCIAILLLFLALPVGFAQAQYFEGSPDDEIGKKTNVKAYNQQGFFCGFWDDCSDVGSCDGLYGLDVKLADEVFTFTLDLAPTNPPNIEADRDVIDLPVGTPINFDFKAHYIYIESGGCWRDAVSLTRVQATGPAQPAACSISNRR
ncbi:MAG: hypothetical protein LBJ64_02585 [Deltaproteobacteria bacterium]|jgi:hypothetical protein|nr:hypothetical protein [Deltaproteobacteria bacterium]